MEKGLVSIVTPCYNGEEYVDVYTKSILSQTYTNIELIFVDDGSTDKTAQKINSYKEEFEKKGIKYTYIYQENQGQAAALNAGLKKVTGEFLTWPDSDDILHEDSIKKRVDFFNHNPSYSMVRNEIRIIDFDTKEQIGVFKLSKEEQKEEIFENLLFNKAVFYAPISYMIRTEKFLEVNPERKIFETRFGQNWQILLPVSYNNKCAYFGEVLCDYIERKNSHSRQKYKTLEEEFYRIDKHIEILREVLTPMNLFEMYKNRIFEKYNKEKLRIVYAYKDIEASKKVINELKKYAKPTFKDYILYYSIRNNILYNIVGFIKKRK